MLHRHAPTQNVKLKPVLKRREGSTNAHWDIGWTSNIVGVAASIEQR
jgi:hypothetical protein